jgi:hypothetical protein
MPYKRNAWNTEGPNARNDRLPVSSKLGGVTGIRCEH